MKKVLITNDKDFKRIFYFETLRDLAEFAIKLLELHVSTIRLNAIFFRCSSVREIKRKFNAINSALNLDTKIVEM